MNVLQILGFLRTKSGIDAKAVLVLLEGLGIQVEFDQISPDGKLDAFRGLALASAKQRTVLMRAAGRFPSGENFSLLFVVEPPAVCAANSTKKLLTMENYSDKVESPKLTSAGSSKSATA